MDLLYVFIHRYDIREIDPYDKGRKFSDYSPDMNTIFWNKLGFERVTWQIPFSFWIFSFTDENLPTISMWRFVSLDILIIFTKGRLYFQLSLRSWTKKCIWTNCEEMETEQKSFVLDVMQKRIEEFEKVTSWILDKIKYFNLFF